MSEYTQPIRERLIKYLYSNIDLGRFRYKIINNETDMVNIKKGYYVTPNYNGINCLLVFMKITDKHYSFLVEKKQLKYELAQVDIKNVQLIPVKVRLREDIYNGSIFDGVLNNGRDKSFTICDTYYLCGKNMVDEDVKSKSIGTSVYVNANYVEDNNMGDLKLNVGKFRYLSETRELISEIGSDARGVAFYPPMSGTKLLLINTQQTITKKEELTDTQIYKDILDNKEGVFLIKKTDIVDVYKMYLLSVVKKGDVQRLQNKKIGIAHIPTTECSNMCRELIGDKDRALVYCKYTKSNNRWVPVRGCKDRGKPNLVSDIYELK